MAEQSKRRSGFPLLLALVLIIVAIPFLIVMRINAFFSRNLVKVSDLKFPVVAIRSTGRPPYAAWDADTLCNISKTSMRIPTNGMILIDSDFTVYTLENVTFNKGDFASIARALFPDVGYRYSFDLRKQKTSGREAALQCILQTHYIADDPADEAPMRTELARQTTFDGVLKTLQQYKPEPAPVPSTQSATTEPDSLPALNRCRNCTHFPNELKARRGSFGVHGIICVHPWLKICRSEWNALRLTSFDKLRTGRAGGLATLSAMGGVCLEYRLLRARLRSRPTKIIGERFSVRLSH
jgi:hypothetical protein